MVYYTATFYTVDRSQCNRREYPRIILIKDNIIINKYLFYRASIL